MKNIITQTQGFKNASVSTQNTILSPSLIGLFENAIEFKNSGFTYENWLNQTSAGSLAKSIVKEIFESAL